MANGWLAGVGLIAVGASLGCNGADLAIGSQRAPIISGQIDEGHPTVGEVLINDNPVTSTSEDLCTGTLVGSHTVLTAAHCLSNADVARTPFRLGGFKYAAESLHPHPSWNAASPYIDDLGLILLAENPPVTPTAVSTRPPVEGMPVQIVGFGEFTLGDPSSAGTKRVGSKVVQSVSPSFFTIVGVNENSADGDSGGPVLASAGAQQIQVGVVSASSYDFATSYHVRVAAFISWLDTTSGGDIVYSDACEGIHCGSSDQAPSVSITAPADGSTVAASLTVTAEVQYDGEIVAVECWVGTFLKKTLRDGPPYACPFELEPGTQVLRVVARDANDNRGVSQISVTVPDDNATDAGTSGGDGGVAGAGSVANGGGCGVAGRPARPASKDLAAALLLLAWLVGRPSVSRPRFKKRQ